MCSSRSSLQEVHNPILCPVGIFSTLCPVKEPAMSSVARRDHPNSRVALDQWSRKHGIGNEGIILSRDDEGGDGDGIENMVCACTIVVVGFAGIASVRGGIAVVELSHPGDTIEFLEIPLAGEERGFSTQSCLQFHEKPFVVHPVARLFQGLDASRGVDRWTDRNRPGQRGF